MKVGFRDGIGRSALAIVFLLAGAFVPATAGSVLAATDTLTLTPSADAWANSAQPTTNYGTATSEQVRAAKAETFIRFNLSAWQGLRISALSLTLQGVTGDATPLRLATTDTTWVESTVNWNTRPSAVTSLASVPVIAGSTAKFDVKPLFSSGFVDRVLLSVRVATPIDLLVTFGSRETTSLKPTLSLDVASRTDTVDLPATADTWANSIYPNSNYGTGTTVRANASPAKEAFLKFDMSAWQGFTYSGLRLRVYLTATSAPTISVYKVATTWKETTLTWGNRPTGGTLLNTVTTSLSSGWRVVDIGSAFASQTVDSPALALRVVGTGVGTMTFYSREGGTAPVVRLVPSTTSPSPSPSPTPTATPTATASPTASPSPSPTATPTATPTPVATPTASPAPTATPTPLFFFKGNGTDHGVGLSQTGAKGRAAAGQTFDQILNAYYTGITLAPVTADKTTIRVLLATSFVPSATNGPARVTALNGSWQSDAFPGLTFAANTYMDMQPQPDGTWTANVYDPTTLAVLATLPAATDVTMSPVDTTTLFYMNFRDSLRKYTTYRGSMRVRVNGSGIMCVNVVGIDDYVQGVIPMEMIPSWPLEALKAQAVAARSYGAARIKTTGYYDVVPTSTMQVYGGYSAEYAKTNTAAQATAGIICWYQDKIANTYFFDTGGGATENSEYAWPSSTGTPGTVIPYLRGIQDVDPNGVPYDINAWNYAWSSGQFSMSQLSRIYGKDSRTNVGTITSLTFYRGVSGRLYKVVLAGSGGTKSVSGMIFKNVYNSYLISGASLKSTLFYLTPVSP